MLSDTGGNVLIIKCGPENPPSSDVNYTGV